MTDLSPEAQAVLDAVASQMEGGWISPEFIPYEARKIAAALVAVADQVVPELDRPRMAVERTLYHEGRLDAVIRHRQHLLAIAAELRGA